MCADAGMQLRLALALLPCTLHGVRAVRVGARAASDRRIHPFSV